MTKVSTSILLIVSVINSMIWNVMVKEIPTNMFELSLKLAPDCIEIEHFDTDTCLIGLEFTIPECNDSIQTLLQEARDLYTTQDKMLDFIGKQYRVKIDFVHLEPKVLNDSEELLVPDQTIHYLKTHDSALFACFTYLKQQETMLIFGQ